MGNIKYGSNVINSILLNDFSEPKNKITLFSGEYEAENSEHYVNYITDQGNSYYVGGLWLAPFNVSTGQSALWPWIWDIGIITEGALKDPILYNNNVLLNNPYWGYIYDGCHKNITQNMRNLTNDPNNPRWGGYDWKWNNDNGWHPAITFWTNNPNGDSCIDFGNHPIIIHFYDDKWSNVNWTNSDGTTLNSDYVSISNDHMTLTIKKVPYNKNASPKYTSGTGIACIGTFNDNGVEDTSLNKLNSLMKDVFVDLEGMDYHHSKFGIFNPCSIESYDAYLGNTQIWHKEKTFENCWKKHKIVVPNNWNILMKYTQSDSEGYTFINPLKCKTTKSWHLKTKEVQLNTNYIAPLSFPAVEIKFTNLPLNSTITYRRIINNVTTSVNIHENITPTANEYRLSISAYNETLYRDNTDIPISYNELDITLTLPDEVNTSVIIEIEKDMSNNDITKIDGSNWNNSWFSIPFINDFNGKQKIQAKIENNDFWQELKNWYNVNQYDSDNFKSGYLFAYSNLDGEISLNMPSNANDPNNNYPMFEHGPRNFLNTNIEKISIYQTDKQCHYSSPYRLFEGATKLKEIDITFHETNVDEKFICSCVNTESMFYGCKSLKTYPSSLIKWDVNRGNALKYTKLCTLCGYTFEYSNLIKIPPYIEGNVSNYTVSDDGSSWIYTNSNNEQVSKRIDTDDSTIVCARTVQMFNDCKLLEIIGPVLDMAIVQPKDGDMMFNNCDKLKIAWIKNLNHGDWYFDTNNDNNTGEYNYHGNIPNLDIKCIKYLFEHLTDLRDHDENYNYDLNTALSFLNWLPDDHKDQKSTIPDWKYNMDATRLMVCRERKPGDIDNLKYNLEQNSIIYFYNDTDYDINFTFTIEGLDANDELYWLNNDDNGNQFWQRLDNGHNEYLACRAKNKCGFILIGDPSNTNIISIEMDNGLDWSKPRTDHAIIHVPKNWITKFNYLGPTEKSRIITEVTNKGWKISYKDDNETYIEYSLNN